MSRKRINEKYEDFKNALRRLEEAVNEDLSKGSIVVDGVIQRFEFTFEMAWKLAKAVLDYSGIEATVPRSVIKEAFKAKLVEDGDGWVDMLEDRNKTAHIYDEAEALKIYEKIKTAHFKLLKDFEGAVLKFEGRE